jgi:hypothetical protein
VSEWQQKKTGQPNPWLTGNEKSFRAEIAEMSGRLYVSDVTGKLSSS